MRQKLNKFLVFSVILIVLSMAVFAAPALKTISFEGTGEGYQLGVLHPPVSKQGDNLNINLHVFNLTSGIPVVNGIRCYLHIYNQSQNHILVLDTDIIEHQFDYEFNVGGDNFTTIGEYSFVAQCNSSGAGGFYGENFIVTNTGNYDTTASNSVIYIIIIPLFIALVLLIISWLLPTEFLSTALSMPFSALKLMLPFLSLFFVYQSYEYAAIIISESFLSSSLIDSIGFNSYVYGWVIWILFAVILITIIYGIFMMFEGGKRKTGEYEE